MMNAYNELQPRVVKRSKNLYAVEFWFAQKRFRYSTAKPLGKDLSPNRQPIDERAEQARILCAVFTLSIAEGWRPQQGGLSLIKALNSADLARQALRRKSSQNLSKCYLTDLERTCRLWLRYCELEAIEELPIKDLSILNFRDFFQWSGVPTSSLPNLKRNLSALLVEEAQAYGVSLPLRQIKVPKSIPTLHKPIENVTALLEDIRVFNSNLHLCCLMTYGMLLRPHREIRCLKFSDFNDHYSMVSLGAGRVKSKQNRIVPVPEYIRELLLQRAPKSGCTDGNIFTLSSHAFNDDYFKTLWSRYKSQTALLSQDQTLYSFRHTGAIRVFEKSGSLATLQRVMGHSDMKVSLTYLRGLEVKQLDVDTLPEL
ncbi:MAG: site-specific integrase [Flavobacteriales bacterium]|jgi:integrase